MGRSPCCAKEGLNRGAWTAHEDKILKDYITAQGEGKWRNLPKKAGLNRCGKSCRLRWLNYLRPDIKRGNISPDEEELIMRLHNLLGNRWSLIAGRLPGRTDNEIKNYWNTTLSKKVRYQHNSTASRNQPNQRNRNRTEAGCFVIPMKSQSPFEMESHVIRTKAIKCSKVLLNPESLQKSENFGSNINTAAGTSMLNGDSCLDHKPILESRTCNINESSSSANGGNNPSDFTMDFTTAEFSLSDLLDSDFSDLCGSSATNSNDDNNVISRFSDQSLVFSEETLQDFWTVQVNNVASNLNSFTSFFESGSGGDWLGC